MNASNIKTLHADDASLARRVGAGDEGAFITFFNEYYDRVYRFAMARVDGDHHLAEDIVQSTMSKALDRIGTYRGEARLFTWLCTICRNSIVDWQRRHGQSATPVQFLEDTPEMQAILDSFHAPATDQPEAVSQREQLIRLIQVVFDNLPARYGDVLEWKYVEGYSAKEIAGELDMSIDATNSLLARAKRAFGELYSPLAKIAVALDFDTKAAV